MTRKYAKFVKVELNREEVDALIYAAKRMLDAGLDASDYDPEDRAKAADMWEALLHGRAKLRDAIDDPPEQSKTDTPG
jgi:hypothetical protein